MAIAACTPQTQTIKLGPIQQPPPSGVCQIDPTSCASRRQYFHGFYLGGPARVRLTMWDRFFARARRLLRGQL